MNDKELLELYSRKYRRARLEIESAIYDGAPRVALVLMTRIAHYARLMQAFGATDFRY